MYRLVVCIASLLPGCATRQSDMLAKESGPAILHPIQAAKEVWAIEHKKADAEIPSDSDIFGNSGYMRVQPVCPLGGTYTLGAVTQHPRCSIPGHTY